MREGPHTGDCTYARSKITPRAASASRFGVCSDGWPKHDRWSARSWSHMMKRMLFTRRVMPAPVVGGYASDASGSIGGCLVTSSYADYHGLSPSLGLTMRLQHLHLLLTLARTGSLRASAEALNVSQPALTKALRQL